MSLDLAAKVLLESAGASFVRFLLPRARVTWMRLSESEIPARPRRLDKLLLGKLDGRPVAIHVDVQATPRHDVPRRVHEYNTLARRRHGRVASIVLYLRRGRRRGPPRDRLFVEVPGLTSLDFRFRAVCAWELRASRVIKDAIPALLPLVPYAEGARPLHVRQAMRRLARVKSVPRRADLQGVLATFAGDIFRDVDWFAMIPKEVRMRSTFIDRCRAEGRCEILAEQLATRLGRRGHAYRRSLEAATRDQMKKAARLLATCPSNEELVVALDVLFGRKPKDQA
jgi:hypothetical protein